MRKNFAKDLEDYIGLINMRLLDISNDIEDLSRILNEVGNELSLICNKMKGVK